MSRTLPHPPLSSLPLSTLQAMTNHMESITERSPRDWFERARYEAEKAVLAERKGNKEEMFLTYTRACQCYMYCRTHPDYAEEKRKDPAWAMRFKDFKEVSGGYWMILTYPDLRRLLGQGQEHKTSTTGETSGEST